MSDGPEVLELPVWLGGCEKWVTGLTKRTTCDDVLYALLHHEGGNPNSYVDVSSFAIFERWREVERPLRGRTKILKVWKAWGQEGNNVKFSVRKVDTLLDTSSEVAKTKRSRRNNSGRDRDRRCRDKARSRSMAGVPLQQPLSASRQHDFLNDNHDQDKTRAFHELVQLVLEQEKTIQDQLVRVKDTDRQIENYETKMHELRMRENGQNYVQEAYLRDRSDESSGGEELFPAIKANDLEAYMHICENILQLEERINNEQERVLDLSVRLQEESILELPPTPPRPFSSYHTTPPPVTRGDRAPLASVPEDKLQEEIERLRQDIQRSQALSEAQQHQMELVSETLQECESQVKSKEEYLSRMLYELKVADSVSGLPPPILDERVVCTSSWKDRHSSSTSGVSEVSEVEGSDRSTDRMRTDSQTRDRARDTSRDRSRERSRERTVSVSSTRGRSSCARESSESTLTGSVSARLKPSHWTFTNLPALVPLRHGSEEQYYITRSYYPISQHYPEVYLTTHKHVSDDSNSDTGLSSLHSDEAPPVLETLV